MNEKKKKESNNTLYFTSKTVVDSGESFTNSSLLFRDIVLLVNEKLKSLVVKKVHI